MEQKIGFIGIGNMAQAILLGILKEKPQIKEQIYVTNRSPEKAKYFANQHGVRYCATNRELAKIADFIFLGVKPKNISEVLEEIKEEVTENKLVISMAAGISIEDLSGGLAKEAKLIRIMPNVNAKVQAGMIVLASNDKVEEKEREEVVGLLSACALVDFVDESYIDLATVISGAGPAFLALFAEAMADASVLAGLPRKKAYTYLAQTLLGTGKLLLEEGLHPAELKDMVCSPAGVTIKGVKSLEEQNFRYILMKAVEDSLDD